MLSIILIAMTIISCLAFLFMAAYVVNFKIKIDRLEDVIDEYEETIYHLKTELVAIKDMNSLEKISSATEDPSAISYKDAQNINWKDVKFK